MHTASSIGSQIAVIGAGISGIACARVLSEAGLSVHVFDKGRRPGGRVSSRTVEKDAHDFSFDYGAQYFTVRHPLFRSVTAKLADKGMVSRWPVAGEDAWVGTPRMAKLIEGLADGIDIAWGAEVTALSSSKSGWSVRIGDSDVRNFDQVVLAMPAEQTALLAGAPRRRIAHRALLDGDARFRRTPADPRGYREGTGYFVGDAQFGQA
jgi:predicted NAD/FAD-dependent oxidoreductase